MARQRRAVSADATPEITVLRTRCRGVRCGCERYTFSRQIGGWRTCECNHAEQTHVLASKR